MSMEALVLLVVCLGTALAAHCECPQTTTTLKTTPTSTSAPKKTTTTTKKPAPTITPKKPTTQNASSTTTAPAAQGKLWALLVAGSNDYFNYRHQADVCHAYQILNAHGITDENIIVMMFDDIAYHDQNPTKGTIINHQDGSDVYKGVLKDYTGATVTPENFINILTGNKDAMKGIGSGRVIESGPNDHVFVNFVDHGATGILGFPSGELVLYIEACESGSMFKDVLPNNINIFATTASDDDENSYACYSDAKRGTYMGDWYSVNWMENSDKVNLFIMFFFREIIGKETLQSQFTIVKTETTTSHVQEYGDLNISTFYVGQFQGLIEPPIINILPKPAFDKGTPSFEVPLDILYRKKTAANTNEKKQELQAEIDAMLEKRRHVETVFKKLVTRVASSRDHHEHLFAIRPQGLRNLDCHHNLIKAFSQNCYNFGQHPYAMKYAYVLANICENGLDAVQAVQEVCKNLTINGIVQ